MASRGYMAVPQDGGGWAVRREGNSRNTSLHANQKEAWDVDAIEFKIRLECAAAAAGFRGLQRGGDGT